MSIAVELQRLATVIERYRSAYPMTTNAKSAPHVVAVAVQIEAGELVVHDAGRRTRENALARPSVGLLWPPQSEAEQSLIVDGEAVVIGESVRVTPTRAVLHRSAPAPEPKAGACGADCVEIDVRGN